jgi:hypothetical protein
VFWLTACGRVGFDPLGGPRDGARGDTGPAIDAPPDAASLPPGPKIWLRMDRDPAGGSGIIDSAGGHVSSCAVGGCPSEVVMGLHAGAYFFTTEEIDVANAADLDSSGGFTAAIWFRMEQTPPTQGCLWTKPFDNAMGYDTFALCVETDSTLAYDCETPGGVTDTDFSPPLSLATWHHAAMSWDGTMKHNYLDGAEITTKAIAIGAGTDPVALGGARGFYFDGRLDDALYYTRALSLAEVVQLATP